MRQIFSITQLFCLVLFFCFSSVFSQNTPSKIAQLDKHADKTLILRVKESYRSYCEEDALGLPDLLHILEKLSVNSIQKIFPRHSPPVQTKSLAGRLSDLSLIYRISYEGNYTVDMALAMIKGLESIEYAEPAYIYDLFYQPNDPFADSTLIQQGAGGQWSLLQIEAYKAWDIQQGEKDIIIGVVDSGHKGDHEDMQDNLFRKANEPIDGIDNDNDGYVDNYAGWDFGGETAGGQGDNDPNVGNVHGFYVSGILGASTDNGIGIAGTSFNCSYLPIKASPDDSLNAIFYGYEGIVYAVDQGAKVVNCSWGGSTKSRFGQDVVRYATINRGAALVVACGNSRRDEKFYPAAYPEALSVANSFYGDQLFSNSTYNFTVDVAAPGGDILTSLGEDRYIGFAGTSAAAPVAAGALGIVVAHFDELTGFQAGQRMRVTADEIYTVNDSSIYRDRLGNGRINLYRALTDPLKPSIRTEAYEVKNGQGNTAFKPGDTLHLSLDFVNYLHSSQDLKIELSIPEEFQSFARIEKGSLDKGIVNMWERFNGDENFVVILDASVPYNLELPIKLSYTDAQTSYVDFEYLELLINKTWLDIEENLLHSSVNSYGNFGFNTAGDEEQGIGISYSQAANVLYEGGFLIGNSGSLVHDRIRNNFFSTDQDFSFTQPIVRVESPQRSDFEAVAQFSDRELFTRLGVDITQHSFAFSDTSHEDYLIFQYIIQNRTAAELSNVYAGLFADWDIVVNGRNKNLSSYDADKKLVYAKDAQGINPICYGISLLTDQEFHAFATPTNSSSFLFRDSDKFAALSNEVDSATAVLGTQNGGVDVSHFISGGPFSVEANGQDTLSFAIVAGNGLSQLQEARAAAQLNYTCRILDKGPNQDFLQASVSNPLEILFSDQNFNATSWSWDFGDDSQAFEQNPIHTYDSAGIYQIVLEVSDGTCSRRFEQNLQIGWAVDLEPGIAQPKLKVFPNPSKGTFRIMLEGNWNGQLILSLLNLSGQELWQKQLKGGGIDQEEQVKALGLAQGMYLLKVKHESYQLYEKIIIE